MRLVFLSLSVYLLLTRVNQSTCDSVLETIAKYINRSNSTWKADSRMGRSSLLSAFWALPGTRANDPFRYLMTTKRFSSINRSLIPEHFDARQQWPYCPTVHEIFEQGKCASCWAVAPTDVMSDRICIHSGGKHIVRLSAGNLLACCRFCGKGCDGGYPGAAWRHWQNKGIVTGSSFFSDYGCQRYQYYPCSRISNVMNTCPPTKPGPKCVHTCQAGYERTYTEDLYFAKSIYRIPNNVEAIQMEIMTNGPVQAVLRVYDDFVTYRSGIYQHLKGKGREYHAIKLLGWGEEEGVPYWLAANAWSRRWGMAGFFKILRGSNHVEIETHVMAGIPLIDSPYDEISANIISQV